MIYTINDARYRTYYREAIIEALLEAKVGVTPIESSEPTETNVPQR